MDWQHDIDCERGCFPGPDTTCDCEVRALRADHERQQRVLRRITLLVGEGERFQKAQQMAEGGLRGWAPGTGTPLSSVVPNDWTPPA